MPQFKAPNIQGPKFEQRERPKATDANPTITSLMGARDRSNFVEVTIPKETSIFDVAFEPICLNSQTPYMPGETYRLPPEVAAEVRTAIKNFEDSIILQMSKKNKAAKGIPTAEAIFEEANMIPLNA